MGLNLIFSFRQVYDRNYLLTTNLVNTTKILMHYYYKVFAITQHHLKFYNSRIALTYATLTVIVYWYCFIQPVEPPVVIPATTSAEQVNMTFITQYMQQMFVQMAGRQKDERPVGMTHKEVEVLVQTLLANQRKAFMAELEDRIKSLKVSDPNWFFLITLKLLWWL